MYAFLINKIIKQIEFNFQNANNHDIERSHTTAGAVSAYCDVLRNIGHDIEHGDWNDAGCLRIGYLKIDGETIVKHSEIDYRKVAELLKK